MRLLAAIALATPLLAYGVASAPAAAAARSPKDVVHALAHGPLTKPLPITLAGSPKPQQVKLSPGSRKQKAVGAVEYGNSGAIVGFLVFPSRALALADLRAFPPDGGPNKVISRRPAGLPRPAYILSAQDDQGRAAAYAVFVLGDMVVDVWTAGHRKQVKELRSIVEKNARWAKAYGLQALRGR